MSTMREKSSAKRLHPGGTAAARRSRRFERLLVAVAGSSEHADAPIDTAAALMDAHQAKAQAWCAVNPFTAAALVVGMQAAVAGAPALRAAERRQRRSLRQHLAERVGDLAPWAVRVALGMPGEVIEHAARTSGADLVVMGLRHHGAFDRIAHDEATLHVARHSAVPVLAVTPALHGMPRVVVVAVDFGAGSAAAAETACALFIGCTELVLVHVQSDFDAARAEHDETTRVIRTAGLSAAFQHLRERLRVPAGATVETVVLRGDAGAELAAFAARRGADVLVLANRHHDVAERMIGGILTTTLVRRAPCSLLITPPEAVHEPNRPRSRATARPRIGRRRPVRRRATSGGAAGRA